MSGIYLEQRRLVRLAEQVAAVSAGEIDAGLYYQQGVTPGIAICPGPTSGGCGG